jgi:hypothetical protein
MGRQVGMDHGRGDGWRRGCRRDHRPSRYPNARELRRWARWLRANPRRQLRGALRHRDPDGTVRVCAIGALEELSPCGRFLFWPRLEHLYLRRVVLLNDTLGWTFPQIAAWLEQIAAGLLGPEEALAVASPSAPAGSRLSLVAGG